MKSTKKPTRTNWKAEATRLQAQSTKDRALVFRLAAIQMGGEMSLSEFMKMLRGDA